MHIDENGIYDIPMLEFVPIVRCKNCKHYIRHDKRCGKLNHGVRTDFFCAMGEPMERSEDAEIH